MTPMDLNEMNKLKSDVDKTIEDANNIVDVPVYQEEDKMLEEVIKLISEPTETTTAFIASIPSIATTIYYHHHVAETTTTEQPSIIQTEESILQMPSTIAVVQEAETILVPITNNESISNYEEKLSIVTTPSHLTTVENAPLVSCTVNKFARQVEK